MESQFPVSAAEADKPLVNKELAWEPQSASVPKRIEDLNAIRSYIDSMDFTLMKAKMSLNDEGGLGWSPVKLDYIEQQYKNWLYLLRKYEGESLPPSDDIDDFWHFHMLDTLAYHRDTAHIFGYYLHHFPYFGARNQSDYGNLVVAFENLQQHYLDEYGEEIYEYDEEDEEDKEETARSMETVPFLRDEQSKELISKELPCFIHIVKNAGNTMRYILYNNYEPATFYNIMLVGRKSLNGKAKTVRSGDTDIVYTVAEIRARQKELACIAANMPFGLDKYVERPLAYFAFMREPVSRCISFWFFIYKLRQEVPTWTVWESYGVDLKRILDERVPYQLCNDQTRMITGTSKLDVGEDEFRLACELIKSRYFLVGTVDSFDACLYLLANRFGWTNLAYERQNVGVEQVSSRLPPRAESLFRDANEWDVRLYEWLTTHYLPHRLAK